MNPEPESKPPRNALLGVLFALLIVAILAIGGYAVFKEYEGSGQQRISETEARCQEEWHKKLVEAGFARYNPKTGVWSLRTPNEVASDPELVEPLPALAEVSVKKAK